MDIKHKRSANSFRFGATKYQIMGSIYAKIPLPNCKKLRMKTHIVPINVPFLIGMYNGMIMNFYKHMLIYENNGTFHYF